MIKLPGWFIVSLALVNAFFATWLMIGAAWFLIDGFRLAEALIASYLALAPASLGASLAGCLTRATPAPNQKES